MNSCIPLEIPTHRAVLIRPSYSSRGVNYEESDDYVLFMEHILCDLLPEDVLCVLTQSRDPDLIKQMILSLSDRLPLLGWNDPEYGPCTFSASFLVQAEYTHGAGRYHCDTMARWLIPGKFLNISSVRSLNFHFVAFPEQNFFFHQILLDIDSDHDLAIVKSNREYLEKEIRLCISAVRNARQVLTVKKLSTEQKQAIIEENLASVIDRPSKNFDNSVFDQMHHFLLHLTAEDKIRKIQEQFAPYLDQKPKVFDRDIFNEIKHSIQMFGDHFTGQRDLKHVSRLISYLYLFRKTLMRANTREERHLSLKLLKTRLSSRTGNKAVLGILGGMNVLRENELFEERHIFEAITHCLPFARLVEDSFILERRSHDFLRLFYLEIEKKDGSSFTLGEIRELKKNLPRELKESVESVLHPVLMPRNEEEIMRNIFLLKQQLKYLNDLPQVIISFNAQTEELLQFTVILLRILRGDEPSLADLFADVDTELKFQELEVKRVGMLRKRYPKEANVFKVSINKRKFLRKDFTIDLFKARQTVSHELNRIFKGIRDFNGGILSKQQEVFSELRNLIKGPEKDFLLENFFYSITPPLRQTLILPATLKSLFTLMQDALEADFKEESFFLKAHLEPDQLLIMAASLQSGFKEKMFSLITQLKIPSSELSSTHVNAYGICCIGYIYQNRDPNLRNLFYSTLLDFLSRSMTSSSEV